MLAVLRRSRPFSQVLDLSSRLLLVGKRTMASQPEDSKRATFGMGCFWAGDSLFGAAAGVIRTCVGYAGGEMENPTYKNIGDHTEVIDIEYDPKIITFENLLSMFWNNHEYGYTTLIKRQYMSMILYHDEEQKKIAAKSLGDRQCENKETIITEIKQFKKFYPAEDYHQKYRLRHHTKFLQEIGLTTPEQVIKSPVAAKLNGYIAGVATADEFDAAAPSLGLDDKAIAYVRKYVIERQGSGLYC